MTSPELSSDLSFAIMDILPNPVLVKDSELRYVWANRAFETLFNVDREELVGRTDSEFFVERQAAQCNGGDLRVLETGETDQAYETVVNSDGEARETITRKSRLIQSEGSVFLVGVMHDITEMQRLANTDPLTGVLNRRSIDEHVTDAFAQVDNRGSLLLFDLDHFKVINDTWGHDAGDKALIHFANIARSVLRAEDQIARIGGEEFAVLLPGAPTEMAIDVAERVLETLHHSPLEWNGEPIVMSSSVGVVTKLNDSPFLLTDWLPLADEQLYRAKDNGRNQVMAA